MKAAQQLRARRSILKVGEGRGFVVQSGRPSVGNPGRYVITAAHCLPKLPPPHPWLEERTFSNLLGALGETATVCAECVFADPIRDIAVLSSPDDQELSDEAESYEELIFAQSTALPIGDIPESSRSAGRQRRATLIWLLHLDGEWLQCSAVTTPGSGLWLSNASKALVGGMSGSPCLDANGVAVGVFSTSSNIAGPGDHTGGGPQARLTQSLPGWLLRYLTYSQPRPRHRR